MIQDKKVKFDAATKRITVVINGYPYSRPIEFGMGAQLRVWEQLRFLYWVENKGERFIDYVIENRFNYENFKGECVGLFLPLEVEPATKEAEAIFSPPIADIFDFVDPESEPLLFQGVEDFFESLGVKKPVPTKSIDEADSQASQNPKTESEPMEQTSGIETQPKGEDSTNNGSKTNEEKAGVPTT